MRKLIVSILIFISFKSQAQVPFKKGTYYPVESIVEYPEKIYWKALMDIPARSNRAYPIEGALWKRYVYPVIIHDTIRIGAVSEVTRKSFDSLIARIKVLEQPSGSQIKYAQDGFPLLNIVNDTTAIVPSLIPGKGITLKKIANSIMIEIQ